MDDSQDNDGSDSTMNRIDLKESCALLVNRLNLKICVKNLLYEITNYIYNNDFSNNIRIPIEDLSRQIYNDVGSINIDSIYQEFLNQNNNILEILVNYFQKVPNTEEYFWLVTFPNLFGCFISEESCSDAYEFIIYLFDLFKDSQLNDKLEKSNSFYYKKSISSAIISYLSHNFFFYERLQNNFFISLTQIRYKKEKALNEFDELSKSLGMSSSALNFYQIRLLKNIFFQSDSGEISDFIKFLKMQILKKLIIPIIKRWEFSPFFQGSDLLYTKNENIYECKLLNELLLDIDKKSDAPLIDKFFEPFIESIKEYDQTYREPEFVLFHSLLEDDRPIYKTLTNFDMVILYNIDYYIHNSKLPEKPINIKPSYLYLYNVIDCLTKKAIPNNSIMTSHISGGNLSSKTSFTDNGEDPQFLNLSVFVLSISQRSPTPNNEIPESQRSIFQSLLSQSRFGFSLRVLVNQCSIVYKKDKNVSQNLDKMYNKEKDLNKETQNFIKEKVENFKKTFLMNSSILSEIIVADISKLISKFEKNPSKRKSFTEKCLLETLKEFALLYEAKKSSGDGKNDGQIECSFSTSCETNISISLKDPKFKYLSMILGDDSQPAKSGEKSDEGNKCQIPDEELSKLISNNERNYFTKKLFLLLTTGSSKGSIDRINLDDSDPLARAIKHVQKMFSYFLRGNLVMEREKTSLSISPKDQRIPNFPKDIHDENTENLLVLMEPFIACLMKPYIFDIKEEEVNKICICLPSFENACSIFNKIVLRISDYNNNDFRGSTVIAISCAIRFLLGGAKDVDKSVENKLLLFLRFMKCEIHFKDYPNLTQLKNFFFADTYQ